MKVIEPGHKYELKSSNKTAQLLYFMKKLPPVGGKKLEVVQDGTTNEEVLKVMIDRMKHLDGIIPCKENRQVIRHLEAASAALERRTADRKARKVEGTPKD